MFKSTKLAVLLTAFLGQAVSAETLFEAQFIARFVEPILTSQPLKLDELTQFPVQDAGRHEYVFLTPRFVTTVTDEKPFRIATANGFFFSNLNHDQQEDFRHWTITDKAEIDATIASFENWVAVHPNAQIAQNCIPSAPTPPAVEILYANAAGFVTPDGNPGLFSLVIQKAPEDPQTPEGNYIILVNPMVGTNSAIACLP